MTLTDLLYGVRRLARPLALGLAVYGCGGSEDYAARCEQLCTRVWKECNGLPDANYNLGNSYNDCIARCPEFMEGVQTYSQTGTMMERLECVASGDYSCQQIGDGDICNMPEGDLFYCFIEGVPEC